MEDFPAGLDELIQKFLALQIGDLHALTAPKGGKKKSAVINEVDERAESDGGGNDATTMSDGGRSPFITVAPSDALKMSCPTVDAFKLTLLLKEVKFTFQIYRARINREPFFHRIDGITEYHHLSRLLSASNASC